MTEIINTFVYPIVRRNWVLDSIASLRACTPANFRVIVVDQTRPNEKFERQLREACDLWIKTKKNYGFAGAVNMGLRIASTEYVTAVNCDTLFFHTGWWQGIVESFKRYDTAVCANSMSPKEPGWGYGEEGYRVHATLEECLEQPDETARRLIEERKGQMIDGLACWCSVFKREVMEQEVGWFDERFNAGGEDYDLMARIYQKKYRAIASSLSWVWHHWGQSKDRRDGLDVAQPRARPPWNKLSTKCDPVEGLWEPDVSIWGENCERVHPEVARFPL